MAAGNLRKKAAPQEPARDLRQSAPMSVPVTPTSSNTVSVGCKLPHGMHLDFRKEGEPTERFTLKGINSLHPKNIAFPVATIGGFAITHGVPKEFFEKWMHDNRYHPAVKNGLIFTHKEVASIQAIGEEREEIANGLDPLDPSKVIVGGVVARSDKD